MRHQFTTLFDYGVFDKFPRLKVLVLESGGGWLGYWLDRIDAVYGHTALGQRVPLKNKPSDYFRERVWVSCDPDERTIPALAERFGATGSCGPPTSRTPTTPPSTCATSKASPTSSTTPTAARSSATTHARCSGSMPDEVGAGDASPAVIYSSSFSSLCGRWR